MKLSMVVISGVLLSSQLLIASTAESQIVQTPVTISFESTSLYASIKVLEQKSKIKFSYDSKTLKKCSINSHEFNDAPLGDILTALLKDTNLSFNEVESGIVIYDKRSINIENSMVNPELPYENTDIVVKGKVSDAQGPLPGVTVKVEGESIGTTTDINGYYTLRAPENGTLIFTYIGFVAKRVPVNNQTTINVMLDVESKSLQEVVVVGYGTQKKTNLTGAVSSVSGDEIITRTAPNTTALLQGRMPGVQITQNSGQPGAENANIQIRGLGSFSKAGNNPLILIDGVEGELNNLNPNLIESISVLKDAASASIYGSRAANGVILVTTKTGKAGRLNIDYSLNLSSQKATSIYDRVTNSVQFMELLNKAIDHTGTSTNQKYTPAEIDLYRQPSEQYPSYDWMDAVFRAAPLQQHFLSINGGKEGTTYNFGLGYLDQEGVLIATDYKRYDAQFNLRTNLGSRVTFGTNISFSNGGRHETALNNNFDGNTTEDQILSALAANPTFKPVLPDGSGRYASKAFLKESGNKNPVALAENGGRGIKNYYTLASAFVNVDILPGLKGEFRGAVKYNDRNSNVHVIGIPTNLYVPDGSGVFAPTPAFNGTVGENNLTSRRENDLQLTYFANLNYAKTFSEIHNISALLGVSQETFRYERLQGFKRNAPSNDLTELGIFSPGGQTADGYAYEWALQSLFGRFNYNFKEKYLFETNFRYDGSSRFPSGNKWGFFPSASAGWRVSEESFLDNITLLDNLKIRASWGQTGNQNVNRDILGESMPYPYQSVLNPFLYNINGSLQQGVTQTDLNNRNVKWETSTVSDIGLDFGLFRSKLFGSLDWYTRQTTDILRELQVPAHIGIAGPTVNKGEMKNTGWEFLLGYENRIRGFQYRVQGNFETYKNELVKFGAREIDGSGLVREEGLPYNSYYMYVFDGIYQNQAEIDNGPTPVVKPKPGDMKYKDLNGDGKVSPDDRTVVSGAYPKFNYGFTLNADYKNFDLSFFLQGVQGRKIYLKEWGVAPFRQASPPPTFWLNAWDGEGTSNTIPHIFNENYAPNTQVSTWWLRDASYMRLKNVQLGYTIPKTMLSRVGVQGLRLFISGDNLVTFTKFFDGVDPERASATGRGAIYPQAKIYTFGLKATL